MDAVAVMRDLGVAEPDSRDTAAYLCTLGADRLGAWHPVPTRLIRGR